MRPNLPAVKGALVYFPRHTHSAQMLGSAGPSIQAVGSDMQHYGTVSLFGSLRQLGNRGYEAA